MNPKSQFREAFFPWIQALFVFLMAAMSHPGRAYPGQDSELGPVSTLALDQRELEMTLEEAVRLTLRNNLDLRIERLNRLRSTSDTEIAAAAFDPIFSTSWTMQKFRSPTVDTLAGLGSTTVILVNPAVRQNFTTGFRGLTPFGLSWELTGSNDRSDTPESAFFGFNPRNDTAISITLTQPLLKEFGYTANLADLRIARENQAIAEASWKTLVETTIQATVNAYWDLYLAQNDLRVRSEGLKEAEQLLEINQQKVAVGTGTEIDVIDARANIKAQESQIIEAKNAAETARDNLLDLLNFRDVLRENGRGVDSRSYRVIEVVLVTEARFDSTNPELDSSLRIALEQRPELDQANRETKRAQIEYERRERNILPRFDVSGTWSNLGLEENVGNSLDELFSGRYSEWRLNANFELAFGNRQAKSERLQAQFDLQSAELARTRLENQVVLEVMRAIRNIESAFQRVGTNREQVNLRKEQLKGETRRLEVGTSTSYNVLQLQQDVLEADLEYVRALVDYEKALAEYKRALGILWSEFSEAQRAVQVPK